MTVSNHRDGGPVHDVEVTRDVRVPTSGSDATLSADVYRPVVRKPVPALITVTPSRKDTMDQAGSVRLSFAERGYAGVLVDLRGTGLSDGDTRPTFDPADADDALVAIEWVASQSWCDGNVGMWGFSSGATMALRAASRRPAGLKAIMPVMGMLDPERDFVHPGGVRGGLIGVAQWGAFNLINQLLPPVHNHAGHAEHRRWRQRLEAEPSIVDFFRHPPGDPTWRARAIDAELISVPAFCVAGWDELHCDATVRAFELIRGPKRLLVGPWGHFLPHRAPVEPIDFMMMATRWWDHWLRGIDNGVMDTPLVTAYVQGSIPGWNGFDEWPPGRRKIFPTARSGAATRSGSGGGDTAHQTMAVYEPDPTIGTLSGWWGAFIDPRRLDQHDDDMRTVTVEFPLDTDVLIVGRPEVSVGLGRSASGVLHVPERLVVRLTEVDDRGRSTLITEGTQRLMPDGDKHRVALWPTAYRVGAGRRLRVTICDASFPRLWPSDDRDPVLLTQVDLSLPAGVAEGTRISVPALDDVPDAKAPRLWSKPRWAITRNPVDDSVEVSMGDEHTTYTAGGEHYHVRNTAFAAKVCRTAPESAVIQGSHSAETRMRTGERVVATVELRMTRAALWVHGCVMVDGMTVFSRSWTAAAAR